MHFIRAFTFLVLNFQWDFTGFNKQTKQNREQCMCLSWLPNKWLSNLLRVGCLKLNTVVHESGLAIGSDLFLFCQSSVWMVSRCLYSGHIDTSLCHFNTHGPFTNRDRFYCFQGPLLKSGDMLNTSWFNLNLNSSFLKPSGAGIGKRVYLLAD